MLSFLRKIRCFSIKKKIGKLIISYFKRFEKLGLNDDIRHKFLMNNQNLIYLLKSPKIVFLTFNTVISKKWVQIRMLQ